MVLHGKAGMQCVCMEAYYPCQGAGDEEGGRMWDRQWQGMEGLEGMGVMGRKKGQNNPRTQLTKDLQEVWVGMANRGAAIVAHLDANLPVRRGDCKNGEQRDEWDSLHKALKEADMICLCKEVWGDRGGVWSYKGKGREGGAIQLAMLGAAPLCGTA